MLESTSAPRRSSSRSSARARAARSCRAMKSWSTTRIPPGCCCHCSALGTWRRRHPRASSAVQAGCSRSRARRRRKRKRQLSASCTVTSPAPSYPSAPMASPSGAARERRRGVPRELPLLPRHRQLPAAARGALRADHRRGEPPCESVDGSGAPLGPLPGDPEDRHDPPRQQGRATRAHPRRAVRRRVRERPSPAQARREPGARAVHRRRQPLAHASATTSSAS